MIKELEWISVDNQLPEENVFVLGYTSFGEYVIVRIINGLSKSDREKMKTGEIPCSYPPERVSGKTGKYPRYEIEKICDERDGHEPYKHPKYGDIPGKNPNPKPYSWELIFNERQKESDWITHWAELR